MEAPISKRVWPLSLPNGLLNGEAVRREWFGHWRPGFGRIDLRTFSKADEMSKIGFAAAGFLLSLLSLVAPVAARHWSPDARGAALDYTQIIHAKGTGEIVVVWWVVPETFMPAANTQTMRDVLSRYGVVGIADGRPGAGGTMSFENIADLKVIDQASRSLSALPANATPADVAQTTSTLQALARQSLGGIGQGMRWFVFD